MTKRALAGTLAVIAIGCSTAIGALPSPPLVPQVLPSGISEYLDWDYDLANSAPLSRGSHVEVYRLVWWPAFRGGTVIEVQRDQTSWCVSAIELGPPSIWPFFRNARSAGKTIRIALSNHEGEQLEAALEDADLWGAVPYRLNLEVDDGWTLIVRGERVGESKVLTRINVDDRYFAALAKTLFDLSTLALPEALERIAGQPHLPRHLAPP